MVGPSLPDVGRNCQKPSLAYQAAMDSWGREACPYHKGYPGYDSCTCSPEVIRRREERAAGRSHEG